MSSHFSAAEVDKKRSFWEKSKWLFFWRPSSIDEKRWAKHAYFRVTIGLGLGIYWAYWHPEYSIISAWYHGSNEPIAHRAKHFDPNDFRTRKVEMGLRNFLGFPMPTRGGECDAEPPSGIIRAEAANAPLDKAKR
jgi:hypothetical protein